MCCGNKRAALTRAAPLAAAGRMSGPGDGNGNGSRTAPPAPPRSDAQVIVFEYTGAAPATVTGPISGRSYRFSRRGDRLAVDARDRPGLLAMASLRWLR
jgi:hypothetical protein